MTLLYAYSFDEASGTVLDYSGNGRSFTLTGNTVRSTVGHTDKGLTQTSAGIQAGPAITGLNTTARTTMAWVKLSAADPAWVLEYHRTTEDTGVWGFLNLSGTFRFRAKNSAGTAFEVNITPDVGNWHHLAATHDGTTLKVYRDGTLIGSGLSMPFPVWDADDVRILDGSGATVVDDPRYYDTVLSGSEIAALMTVPVSIANTWTSSSTVTTAATSTSIDITAAPVGDWVYCFAAIGSNETSVTMTGWTRVIEGDESTSTHYALFRRLKQSGDTTFTMSWPTSSKGTFGLSAWTGLDPTTPDELAQAQLHTSGTSYPTPSLTPGGPGRYAATFTYSRTSTSGNKAISFTPASGLAERLDFNNSAAASAPWTGQEIADSSAPVTVAAQSYTAVQAFSESHGGAILLYLVPPQSGITGTASPTQAADTSTASGQLGYSGSSAATQAGNTSTATGSVINPVTGTAAASQAAQTPTATGKLGYSGTVSRTQASQTPAASGQLGYSGTGTPTQAGSTASASGTFTGLGFSGNAAVAEANDTASAAGKLGYSGTSAATQANQSAAAIGKLGYSGSAPANQAAQTSTASGTFTSAGAFSGTAAAAQANQTASSTGKLGYTATAFPTQASNTPAASGTVVNPVTGTGSPLQAGQFSIANGILRYSATGATVQAPNTSTGAGVVSGPVSGSATAMQADQTAAGAGQFAPLVSAGTASGAVGMVATATSATPGSSGSATAGPGSMTVPSASGG